MAISYDKLMNWKFDDVRQTYAKRDTMLYALGLGCGADPMDESDLRYVYEENLVALPTMVAVLGALGFWARNPESGIDWKKVVHGEQTIKLHAPLPVAASIVGKSRIVALVDKGRDKGALMLSERTITDKATGTLLATTTSTSFMRGDGGFGGPASAKESLEPHKLPDRKPDTALAIKTLPQAALIYRLSGDYNPLHADPKVGAAAGFKAPILHGLCSFGVAGRAIVKACCGGDAAKLKGMQVRFSAPIYPGETIETHMWKDGENVSFRARCVERDIVIINNGLAKVG